MLTIQVFLINLFPNVLPFQLYKYIYKNFFDVYEFNDFWYKVIKCLLTNTNEALL